MSLSVNLQNWNVVIRSGVVAIYFVAPPVPESWANSIKPLKANNLHLQSVLLHHLQQRHVTDSTVSSIVNDASRVISE